MASNSALFRPITIGKITTGHRIAMTPLTRFRAEDNHVHGPLARTYYAQRAAVPGTLLFTEATQISPRAGGLGNAPGIWTQAQILAWKDIVDGVHEKGSFIFCQLYAAGRMAQPDLATKEGFDIMGPSAISVSGREFATPIALREEEIWAFVADFAQAAENAMDAGFDGVEIHAAYGTLVDQFIQDTANQRLDSWGGSVERRSRFPLEILKAVGDKIGIEHVGIRFSPWSTFLSMRMTDPHSQYVYLLKEIAQLGIQHLHLVEPRVDGIYDVETVDSNDVLIDTWFKNSDVPLVSAGGYLPDDAKRTVDEKYRGKNVVIAFGRYFSSNPDLVYKIKAGIPFVKYDRAVLYAIKDPKGYADWPYSPEFLAEEERKEHA